MKHDSFTEQCDSRASIIHIPFSTLGGFDFSDLSYLATIAVPDKIPSFYIPFSCLINRLPASCRTTCVQQYPLFDGRNTTIALMHPFHHIYPSHASHRMEFSNLLNYLALPIRSEQHSSFKKCDLSYKLASSRFL